jgi:hypothetical protein
MSLIKKVDVDKHFAARRAMRLGRSGPLSQAGARIERTFKAKSATTFIDVKADPVAGDIDGTDASIVSRSRPA